MLGNKTVFILLVVVWSCSMTVFGISAPPSPLKNHVTGGFKGNPYRNGISDSDCSQFSSDYDILYQFPFQIMINPINYDWQKSMAYMGDGEDVVSQLELRHEDFVPLSIFCLKNLQYLTINNVTFPNGVIPDSLGNLRYLRSISIDNSHITNISDQLGFLRNLYSLRFSSCNLTNLPDLSGISSLSEVFLFNNQLSKISGLNSVYSLYLDYNLFTDVPTIKTSGNLNTLSMNNNPVKNMITITSYTNLRSLHLGSTKLSSIPHTIDKLQKLEYLYLDDNKLFYLPTNILNLPNLRYLFFQNNLFSSNDIQTFQSRFNQTNPNVTVYF